MLHPRNPRFQGWNTILRIKDETVHKIGKYVVASVEKHGGGGDGAVVEGVVLLRKNGPVFERRVSV